MFTGDVCGLISRTLNRVDPRLVDHGTRVARTVFQMLSLQGRYSDRERRDIYLVALLHDIGAYKTEEIDQMVRFETEDVWGHSIYGYLFLHHLSPLKRWAQAVLYHHAGVQELAGVGAQCREVAQMLALADRADIYLRTPGTNWEGLKKHLLQDCDRRYDAGMLGLLVEAKERALREEAWPSRPKDDFSPEEREAYLRMIVYAIDFRSPHTVTHTITTTQISVEIAKALGMDGAWLRRIWYGALLHDLGKIGIPVQILEYPGKLSAHEMDVMRTHVDITERILDGALDLETSNIALRHHEKLDGSGYPRALPAAALNTAERIVAVADMASALLGTRSYKTAFSKARTLAILQDEAQRGKIDCACVDAFAGRFDEIMEQVGSRCTPVIETYRGIQAAYTRLMARRAAP